MIHGLDKKLDFFATVSFWLTISQKCMTYFQVIWRSQFSRINVSIEWKESTNFLLYKVHQLVFLLLDEHFTDFCSLLTGTSEETSCLLMGYGCRIKSQFWKCTTKIYNSNNCQQHLLGLLALNEVFAPIQEVLPWYQSQKTVCVQRIHAFAMKGQIASIGELGSLRIFELAPDRKARIQIIWREAIAQQQGTCFACWKVPGSIPALSSLIACQTLVRGKFMAALCMLKWMPKI